MPFYSKAQIEKFKQMHKEGKVGLSDIAGKSLGTKDNLPERVGRPKNADKDNERPTPKI